MSRSTKGWVEVCLGDVADVVLGKTPRRLESCDQGTVPFYKVGDMNASQDRWMGESRTYLDDAQIEQHRLRVLRRGSVIFPKVGGAIATNKKRVIGRPAAVDTNTMAVVANQEVVRDEFLFYWLGSIRLSSIAYGSPVPQISRGGVSSLPIPLPPLAEQERIVAAIDEHFSHLDAAEASIRRGARNVERLRQSLLQDLTAGDWPRHPLHDLVTHLRNGMFVSRPGPQPPGVPIFRISAVRPLTLDVSDIRYADIEPGDGEAFRVDEGDVLFTRYSGNPAYVGACAVVPAAGAGVLHPDKLIRAVPDRSRVLPHWIAMYLSVGAGRKQIDARLKTTAGQVGIAGGQLKQVEIAVPPIPEQERLVDRWESQTGMTDAVAKDLHAASDRTLALRRSVLAAAFTGELVPQDASDEPASALLERIRDHREKAEPARRKRKAKTS